MLVDGSEALLAKRVDSCGEHQGDEDDVHGICACRDACLGCIDDHRNCSRPDARVVSARFSRIETRHEGGPVVALEHAAHKVEVMGVVERLNEAVGRPQSGDVHEERVENANEEIGCRRMQDRAKRAAASVGCGFGIRVLRILSTLRIRLICPPLWGKARSEQRNHTYRQSGKQHRCP